MSRLAALSLQAMIPAGVSLVHDTNTDRRQTAGQMLAIIIHGSLP
jgi:hypothetical protein